MEVPGSHAVYVSHPDAVAGLIAKAAGGARASARSGESILGRIGRSRRSTAAFRSRTRGPVPSSLPPRNPPDEWPEVGEQVTGTIGSREGSSRRTSGREMTPSPPRASRA